MWVFYSLAALNLLIAFILFVDGKLFGIFSLLVALVPLLAAWQVKSERERE